MTAQTPIHVYSEIGKLKKCCSTDLVRKLKILCQTTWNACCLMTFHS